MFAAVRRDDVCAIKTLVELGADLDARKKVPYLPSLRRVSLNATLVQYGGTALHVACRCKLQSSVEALLENGADPNAVAQVQIRAHQGMSEVALMSTRCAVEDNGCARRCRGWRFGNYAPVDRSGRGYQRA